MINRRTLLKSLALGASTLPLNAAFAATSPKKETKFHLFPKYQYHQRAKVKLASTHRAGRQGWL